MIILKFGDVVTAVASLAVIGMLILLPIVFVLTLALGNFGGFMLGVVVSFLLSAVIVGYIFTQKIWEENRTKTIAQITVLFTVLVVSVSLVENATVEWVPMFRAAYLNANPTATPSASDWYYIERLELIGEDFFVVVLMLAITFIGLYIGSTLKKPTKT